MSDDPHGLWAAFHDDPFGEKDGLPPAWGLADWLEEQGDLASAEAARWMWLNRRTPFYAAYLKKYDWWDADRAAPCFSGKDDHSDIPGAVFAALSGGEPGGHTLQRPDRPRYRSYTSFRDAVADLGRALVSVGAAP